MRAAGSWRCSCRDSSPAWVSSTTGIPWRALGFVVAAIVTGFGPWNPLDVEIDVDDPARGLRNVLLASIPFLAVALWSAVDAWRRAGERPG